MCNIVKSVSLRAETKEQTMGVMIFDQVPLELSLNITFNISPISDRYVGNDHPEERIFKIVHF